MWSELDLERVQEKLAELGRVVTAGRRRDRWLILTHDNPDPDALASALLLSRLVRSAFHRPAKIAYGGLIGRAENQEMVRTLKLDLSRVRRIKWSAYQHFALVDCQPGTGNHQLPDDIQPDVVIDHHPTRRATHASKYYDLRREYGATASILAEYLLASGLPVTKREATAVVYAIRSETLDFARESLGPDRQLYDHFLALADKRALGKIQRPRLPVSYFSTLREGLSTLEQVDTLIVSRLGTVAQPDIVPEIADLLLRMESKTWSLCTGWFEDRLYCSIRTTNTRADASSLMRRLVGRHGKGGGHGMLAGGWIPAPGLSPDEIEERERLLARRLAKMLRKNPERLTALEL